VKGERGGGREREGGRERGERDGERERVVDRMCESFLYYAEIHQAAIDIEVSLRCCCC